MESAREKQALRILRRLGQNFIPTSEAHQHFERHRDKAVRERRVLLHQTGRQFRDHRAGMFHRDFALPRHQRAISQHVAVVRRVDRKQTSGRSDDLPVTLVRLDRFHVRVDRLLPAAAANVDVRRHVNVVRQARLQLAQPVGRRVRALGIRRSFDRVNVEMVRERMVLIEFQDRIERRQDFIRARVRLRLLASTGPTAAGPSSLRRKARRRPDRSGTVFQTSRIAARVGFIERLAVLRLRVGITLAQRLDQGALDRRRLFRVFLRELQFLPGQLGRRRRDQRVIDMRPVRQRDPPMRHRALRIEPRRLLERPDRRAMIEPIEEPQPLVEIALRLRRLGRNFPWNTIRVPRTPVPSRREHRGSRMRSLR